MKFSADKLVLDEANFLRLDGVAGCKVVEEEGRILLEFFDRDRLRASCRGDHLLTIDLQEFVARVEELVNERKPPLVK